MSKAVLALAVGISLLAVSVAAKDDLSTLRGFERAFWRGHAKSSIEQLEKLVYWDNAMPNYRNRMYRALYAGFSYVIDRIGVEPFAESTKRWLSPAEWSVKPNYNLIVWYADDIGQPSFPVRYPIGKRDGEFRFAVIVQPPKIDFKRMPLPPIPPLREPTAPAPVRIKPTDDPYLQRFMTERFELVDRTKDIDPGVFAVLRAKIGSHSRFAERGQAFSLSDVVQSGDDPLPDRRFVLAGHDGDIWFIKYIRGGFSPYAVLVIFSKTDGNWKIVSSAYGEWRKSEGNSLEELRRSVQLGSYFRGGPL